MLKADYEYYKVIEKCYNTNCSKLRELEYKVNGEKTFISKLKNKLNGTKSVVYHIKKDRDGMDTYVCVQDLRKPRMAENKAPYLSGDLNIFIMNTRINPSDCDCRYNDMPFLQARFDEKKVHIYELHSCINGVSYENKGYGTMMLEALIDIGRESGCTSIEGHLSIVDCDTDEKRDRRNRFYKNRRFILSFSDEECKNGRLYYAI